MVNSGGTQSEIFFQELVMLRGASCTGHAVHRPNWNVIVIGTGTQENKFDDV